MPPKFHVQGVDHWPGNCDCYPVMTDAPKTVGGINKVEGPVNSPHYDDPINYAALSLYDLFGLWQGETKLLTRWAATRIATYRRLVVDYAAAFQMTPGTAEDKRQRAIEATGGLTLAIPYELDIVKEILHGADKSPAQGQTTPPASYDVTFPKEGR